MNKVILAGNVGNEPEVNVINETALVKFSLATNKKYTNKQGEIIIQTAWHSVQFWGKQADTLAEYLKKGMPLLIEGEIEYKNYEKNGEKRYFTQIRGVSFEFIGRKSDTDNTREQTQTRPQEQTDNSMDNTDDLPF